MIGLKEYATELNAELQNILQYWMDYTIDVGDDGFYGRVDNSNRADIYADKGSVLNSRILWALSAGWMQTKKVDYLVCAERAWHYFTDHFIDNEYGGVYWSVKYNGEPADTKKQIYAQSFAIYAFSEFFRASGLLQAKQSAIDLFSVIEQYSYDNKQGGYIDAFTQDWQQIPDMRLSAKDANAAKTMNTHLHVLEAYTNLYRIWPDNKLKLRIAGLLQNFTDHIIDNKTNHLVLFFDECWNRQSDIISYGHDIEAAWLLQEAAEVIADTAWIDCTKAIAVTIAAAATNGLDTDGGLWYEYNASEKHLVKEKHWWPQAEAMVGFFNAWQTSKDNKYLELSASSWNFIKKHIRDDKGGEWLWGVYADYSPMKEDKVGPWKCPYHNSRACIEIIGRIQKLNNRSL